MHWKYKCVERIGLHRPGRGRAHSFGEGVSLSIRNDASYIIDMNFSFYEHQSTYNRNMTLRSMIYFVNALDDWLKENEHDLFGRKRIMIPTPHFVVFYNGVEKRPEYERHWVTGTIRRI